MVGTLERVAADNYLELQNYFQAAKRSGDSTASKLEECRKQAAPNGARILNEHSVLKTGCRYAAGQSLYP